MLEKDRKELTDRVIYFYHVVMVDIRNLLGEKHTPEKLLKARDLADIFEPVALDFFLNWKKPTVSEVYADMNRQISWFEDQYGKRPRYREIFNLPYQTFLERHLHYPKVDQQDDGQSEQEADIPNLEHDLYVVLQHSSRLSDPIEAIKGVRVYTDEAEAEAEASRLNGMQSGQIQTETSYFVRYIRMKK